MNEQIMQLIRSVVEPGLLFTFCTFVDSTKNSTLFNVAFYYSLLDIVDCDELDVEQLGSSTDRCFIVKFLACNDYWTNR